MTGTGFHFYVCSFFFLDGGGVSGVLLSVLFRCRLVLCISGSYS